MQTQVTKTSPGTQAAAQAETTTPEAFNISLTKQQAKYIDDFFMYFPCNDESSQPLNQRLDFYFIEILNGASEVKGTDYLFFMLLKELLPSLESIRKQLNP